MNNNINHNPSGLKKVCKLFFFAGAETGDNSFNIFTGWFIRLMREIFDDDFVLIKGINFRLAFMNVLWALNNAQKPIRNPENNKKINEALKQIMGARDLSESQIILVASSSGSVMAAQAAVCLAEKNKSNDYFREPLHLVLGASMISAQSELFKRLLSLQNEGSIGIILHDEVQDEGDTSVSVGGITRI